MNNKPLFKFIIFGVILAFTSILNADTTYVSGHISAPYTTWDTAGSPYIITGHVYVDTSCTLVIEPGVTVLFHQPRPYIYEINVWGYLIAEGTETDSIFFIADTLIDPRNPQWHSIHFNNESDSISILNYCKIVRGFWSVITEYGNQTIRNCEVLLAEGSGFNVGIYCWNTSKPTIIDNDISCIYGTEIGIDLENNTEVVIKHNRLGNLSSGIIMQHNSSASIDSNQLSQLFEGIKILNSSPDCEIKIRWNVFENIENNAISNNYYSNVDIHDNVLSTVGEVGIGIVYYAGSCDIRNNIIIDVDLYSIAILHYQPLDTIKRNCFNDGSIFRIEPEESLIAFGEIVTTNENSDSCDIYYNLFTNPYFADTMNYFLSDSSPCIDAGDPTLPWDPDSTPPDIGAHYYDTTTDIIETIANKPADFELLCYPNPFNAVVNIKIAFVRAIGRSPLQVEIFDINGRIIRTFHTSPLMQGGNTRGDLKWPKHLTWTPDEHISSGIYLIKAIIGKKTITKQVVYLK